MPTDRGAALRRLIGTAARRARLVPTVPAAPSPMDGVLEWLGARDAFTIVQIGAYVGDTENDPLARFLRQQDWRDGRSKVVLVEPVREFFDQLVRNYAGLGFARFENVAVAVEPGVHDFYRLAADPAAHGFPEWLSQLGSLRADRMTQLWDAYERDPRMREFYLANRRVERVTCVTLQDLFDRHGVVAPDLLQIDAEGSDYEILRTVDFTRARPRFVNYERVLLGADEPACRAMMRDAGYVLFDWAQDTLCVAVV